LWGIASREEALGTFMWLCVAFGLERWEGGWGGEMEGCVEKD
jgi:hypothetical protein